MGDILLVDDDPSVLEAFGDLLRGLDHSVRTAPRGDTALEYLEQARPDLVIMDVRMPGPSGLETFRRIKEIDPKLPVIIMTGYSTTAIAIEATKLGAFDYHLKPLEPDEILKTIDAALNCVRLMKRQVALDDRPPDVVDEAEDVIVGQGEAMREVYKAIGRVAETDATVLVRGDTGTGKELVARAIYQHSLRAKAPLVVVNCVAVPEALLESEIFGHERGAFTGAENRRIGKFEQAHGGTVFLDEIGDMPLGLQAKLLRVLQERTLERLGGNEVIPVDVRVIAATNRDLEQAIAQGAFREDLYHRLKVFTIDLPPLSRRGEDLPRLVAYFVERFARQLNIDPPLVSATAMAALAEHGWPGNVRELEHCLHRALIVTGGYPVQAEDIARALEQDDAPRPERLDQADELRDLARRHLDGRDGQAGLNRFVDAAERAVLEEAMERAQGNQTRAAKLLGIPRPTLKSKLDKHDLLP